MERGRPEKIAACGSSYATGYTREFVGLRESPYELPQAAIFASGPELARRHAAPAHEGMAETRCFAESQGFGDLVNR
ncbi:hypothetical protein PS691_00697 [Pseudomonas fluorescens]|uniref:Uncharacterized protein n=1 Tax=Pseudomonas fluorescens TaxID=294 RepID=A0A5E7AHP3_PSEFL|nr:hypothetical protein PS691_00697 [Pseudomonas fluorescens]